MPATTSSYTFLAVAYMITGTSIKELSALSYTPI